jgi:glycosyltransferase involved in cell wall biosynthesis
VRIVIASTHVPFTRGGDTRIVRSLRHELTARGFTTDVVSLPFSPNWPAVPGQTVALRLLDLTESCGNRIDRLITVRYPSYAIRHPNKVAWFIHHHREAYDLWGTDYGGMPETAVGRHYRDMTHRSDTLYLSECQKVFTNSKVVAARLKKFNGVEADGVLYPPLPAEFPAREGPFGDYLFYPSRLTPIKRQKLAVEALAQADPAVRLVIAGGADSEAYLDELNETVRERGLEGRVELLGFVDEERKAELMAGCCGALYLAYDEDSYGYVTLEAFHSGKPVVTLADSGGSLEVVEDGVTGCVAEPDAAGLAAAMDRLWKDRAAARRMGAEAQASLGRHRIDWDHVVESLTS